jgi:hypothetical protein
MRRTRTFIDISSLGQLDLLSTEDENSVRSRPAGILAIQLPVMAMIECQALGDHAGHVQQLAPQ